MTVKQEFARLVRGKERLSKAELKDFCSTHHSTEWRSVGKDRLQIKFHAREGFINVDEFLVNWENRMLKELEDQLTRCMQMDNTRTIQLLTNKLGLKDGDLSSGSQEGTLEWRCSDGSHETVTIQRMLVWIVQQMNAEVDSTELLQRLLFGLSLYR